MSRDNEILLVEDCLAEPGHLSPSPEGQGDQNLIAVNDISVVNKSENIIQITETPQDNFHSTLAGTGAIGESKEWLRAVFDASPDGILVVEAGEIIFVNRGCGKLLGYENPEELIGKNFSDVLTPVATASDGADCAGSFREAAPPRADSATPPPPPPAPAVYEVKAQGKDDSMIELEAAVSDSVIGGKPYTIVTVRNVCGHKQSAQLIKENEARFQQSQKMEAIGTLTGGVAHDFNNLLTAIIGNTQLAMCKIQPDDPLRVRLTEIEKASNRAAVLTRQLLAFSRRQHLERRSINLNDTICEIVKLLQRIIGEDIEVSVQTAADLPKAFADPAQIEQVVMNLCVNAREAMPGGGRIVIETSDVEFKESSSTRHAFIKPGKYVQLKISDDGSGMDEDTKARIFEPFFTTKGMGGKSGLGLSMAYGIVRQHDGYITVETSVGEGTAFKVFLPVDEKIVEAERESVQLSLFGGTETILVAEDEEALRDLAKDVLCRLGYTVLLAKNGEEAVEIFAENRDRIDLLLFDIVMPRMGGAEAFERIRDAGGNVPLIFMTGYSSERIPTRFGKQKKSHDKLEAAVVQKPYNVPALGHKVREVLDAHAQSEPLKKTAG